MKYKLAIFDFDGTLADSLPWAASVVNEFADQYGFQRIDPHDHEMLRNLEAKQLMQHLGVKMWKVPQMAMHVRRRMAEEIDKIPLFPGVDAMLQRLAAAGMILSVVSSNSEANVRQVIGPQNVALIRDFDCGASVFGKAPKLKAVMKRCRVEPAQAILIGDEIRDGKAARKVEMAFGAVGWGYTNPEALHALAPEEFFTTLEEIAERLTK
jgi:phosphoglycolate phosphatase